MKIEESSCKEEKEEGEENEEETECQDTKTLTRFV